MDWRERKIMGRSRFVHSGNLAIRDICTLSRSDMLEFVTCGYTYFPLRKISQELKAKSARKPGSKANDYEKEYMVIIIINGQHVTPTVIKLES